VTSDTDDVVADLRAALDLVPPGRADGARARVLVALAKHGWQLRGPEASAAVDEALELARRPVTQPRRRPRWTSWQ
jgi:hypothetical protein